MNLHDISCCNCLETFRGNPYDDRTLHVRCQYIVRIGCSLKGIGKEVGSDLQLSVDRIVELQTMQSVRVTASPLSTILCPHPKQRYASTAYKVMSPTGRLKIALSVIPAGRRVRVHIIHAGGMPAFSSSAAEGANLFTEVLLKGGR